MPEKRWWICSIIGTVIYTLDFHICFYNFSEYDVQAYIQCPFIYYPSAFKVVHPPGIFASKTHLFNQYHSLLFSLIEQPFCNLQFAWHFYTLQLCRVYVQFSSWFQDYSCRVQSHGVGHGTLLCNLISSTSHLPPMHCSIDDLIPMPHTFSWQSLMPRIVRYLLLTHSSWSIQPISNSVKI